MSAREEDFEDFDFSEAADDEKEVNNCTGTDIRTPEAAIKFWLEKSPKSIFVKGAPGTGKTRFLAKAALEIGTNHQNVLCYVPQEGYNMFLEELRKEQQGRKNTVEEEGYVVTIEEILSGEMENLEESLKKAKIVVAHSQTEQYQKFIGLTRNKFFHDVVIFDFLNYIPLSTFNYHYQHSRVIASFDEKQPMMSIAPPITDIARMKYPRISEYNFLHLTRSNRPDYFLKWPNMFCYYGKLKGFDPGLQYPVEFHNTAGKVPKAKHSRRGGARDPNYWTIPVEAQIVVEIVEKLLGDNVEPGDIAVGTPHEQQCKLIKKLLGESSNNKSTQVRVGNVRNCQFWRPVKHFVFSMAAQHTEQFYQTRQLLTPNLIVAVTRPSEQLHFVGNGEVFGSSRQRSSLFCFLKWLEGEPIPHRVQRRNQNE